MLLVADVGGTGSRLSVVAGERVLVPVKEYCNAEFGSFDDILHLFLSTVERRPARAALAVAGPVVGHSVCMTNLGWRLDATRLKVDFGFSRVLLMNDFEALAWSTLSLTDSDLVRIGGGSPKESGNRVIVGPGTGLGVAGLVKTEQGWAAVAGEGGHVSLAANSSEEQGLIDSVREELGHCSAERLVSGPGLTRIMSGLGYGSIPPWEVVGRAIDGDAQSMHAARVFIQLLATVASDLALTFGAAGGVYLGGGILPRLVELVPQLGLRQRFESKGRYRNYLAEIPVWIITRTNPSLLGLVRKAG